MGWGNHHASYDSPESWEIFYKQQEQSKQRTTLRKQSKEFVAKSFGEFPTFLENCSNCKTNKSDAFDFDGCCWSGLCDDCRKRQSKLAGLILGCLTPVNIKHKGE